jgi:hypothetical protein
MADEQRLAAIKAEHERQAKAAVVFGKADPIGNEDKKVIPPVEMEVQQQQQQAQVPLPQFPWPPPTASAFYVLRDNWFASLHTLGEVVGAIISALERRGYVERSFFRTEGSGVALVTRLERIGSDGSSFIEAQRCREPAIP